MAGEYDAAITKILLHYYPHFDPPENAKEWNQTCCPDHLEERPSFSVNYEIGAFKCHACDFRGDAVSLIRRKEGFTRRAQAERYAEELSGGSYNAVQGGTTGKSRRRVFGESGTDSRSSTVPSRVRSRTTPWT